MTGYRMSWLVLLSSILALVFFQVLELRADDNADQKKAKDPAGRHPGKDIGGSGARTEKSGEKQSPKATKSDDDGAVDQGIGHVVSGWSHQGIHGKDLAARIHALKGKQKHKHGQDQIKKGGGDNNPKAEDGKGPGKRLEQGQNQLKKGGDDNTPKAAGGKGVGRMPADQGRKGQAGKQAGQNPNKADSDDDEKDNDQGGPSGKSHGHGEGRNK